MVNFGLVARGMARANDRRRGIERQDEQDERQRVADERAQEMTAIQQAALLAGLGEKGISRGGEGDPLGNTGFRQDPTMTRRAQQMAAERARQERLNQRRAVLKARGLNPDEVDVENDDIYESFAKFQKPEGPKAPTPGTPEYYAMREKEAQIAARYRPAPRSQMPTESERKNAALLMSGEQGYKTLDKILKTGKKAPSLKDSMLSKVGMGAGNYMTSDEHRQMQQASLQLADAWLRFTTGANAPEPEVQRVAQTFIPQPGDDDGTLLQKAQSRRTIIMALRQGAGRAAPKEVVEDDDVPYQEY